MRWGEPTDGAFSCCSFSSSLARFVFAEAIAPPDKVQILTRGKRASASASSSSSSSSSSAAPIDGSDDDVGGVAVITFPNRDGSDKAIAALNGIEIAGKRINAGRLGPMGDVQTPDGLSFTLDGRAGSNALVTRPGGRGGPQLSAQARAALAAQLAGATTAAAQTLGSTLLASTAAAQAVGTAAGAGTAMISGITPGVATTCLLLRNCFDLREIQASGERDWEDRVQDDIEGEAKRFGRVLHSHVVRDGAGGLVYLMLDSAAAAVACASALNGRSYCGRALAVEFVSLPDYTSRFPSVSRLVG